MQVLIPTLGQLAKLFIFIVVGYVLSITKVIPEKGEGVLSKLVVNIFLPAMIIETFMRNCTVKALSDNAMALVYAIGVLIVTTVISLFAAKLFAGNQYEVGIFKYSFDVPNTGFFGYPLILGIFGSEVLFRFMVFLIPLNAFVYAYAVNWLVPGKKFSLKGLLNPVFVSMIIGAILGLSGLKLPALVTEVVSGASDCMSPMAMILTGIVIGRYNIIDLLKRWSVYPAAVIRMLLMPVVFGFAMKLMGAPQEIVFFTAASLGMPFGLNTVVFPAAYGGDTTLGAGMALVSNIMIAATLPIIFSVFSA